MMRLQLDEHLLSMQSAVANAFGHAAAIHPGLELTAILLVLTAPGLRPAITGRR